MLELTNLKGNTWAVLSPVNVGVCVKDGEVALIEFDGDDEEEE